MSRIPAVRPAEIGAGVVWVEERRHADGSVERDPVPPPCVCCGKVPQIAIEVRDAIVPDDDDVEP